MSDEQEETFDATVRVSRSHGLHTAPSGQLASFAKQAGCRVSVWKGEQEADARNMLEIGMLDAREGDEVRLVCIGQGAAFTGKKIARFLSGLEELFEF